MVEKRGSLMAAPRLLKHVASAGSTVRTECASLKAAPHTHSAVDPHIALNTAAGSTIACSSTALSWTANRMIISESKVKSVYKDKQ